MLTTVALAYGTAAGPALADDTTTTTTPQAGPDFWTPPVLSDGEVQSLVNQLNPNPVPLAGFNPKSGCVTSSGNDIPLTTIPPAQQMLNISKAQQFATGKGVTVAVIDTGVNPHPFLTGHLEGGGDFVSNGNGESDCDGHGTLTAGIVAARTTPSGAGFTGVAPDSNIMAIRQTSQVFQDANNNTAGTAATLADAILHAVRSGAQVITTSVDICFPADEARDKMQTDPDFLRLEAVIQYAYEQNVVVVNSAGNTPSQPDPNQSGGSSSQSASPCQSVPQNGNSNPNQVAQIEFPAVYSNFLLSVASVNPAQAPTQNAPSPGSVSTFSEWGPWVNIAAPGEDIISIDPGVGATGLANTFAEPSSSGSSQAPQTIQGTSFAAPYVAGVAALVRQKFPTMNAAEVIRRIEVTAQHPSGQDGRNNQVGFGVIDPVSALTADVPGQNGVPTAAGTKIGAQLPQNATHDWAQLRIALLGAAGCGVLLLATLFVVRTRRRAKGVGDI
jgi:membrane-anchored mycosin MYCP